MTLNAIVVAPPNRAEFARQALVSAFLETKNGRLTPHGRPPGAECLATEPLAAFALEAEGGDPTTARTALAHMFAGEPIDWAVTVGDPVRPRVVVCDMDSTIVTCESLDELADALGFGGKVKAITDKAMRGELDFAGALRERVALLRGAPLTVLDAVWRARIATAITPHARTVIATLKAQGAYTALVTGGFTTYAARVAAAVGFDTIEANELHDDGAKLTGRVGEPIKDGQAKRATLETLSYAHGEGPEDAVAIGDGANDKPMVETAGLGVAYCAKPALAQVAPARVTSGDLRAVLLFLRIPPRDWIVVPDAPAEG